MTGVISEDRAMMRCTDQGNDALARALAMGRPHIEHWSRSGPNRASQGRPHIEHWHFLSMALVGI